MSKERYLKVLIQLLILSTISYGRLNTVMEF